MSSGGGRGDCEPGALLWPSDRRGSLPPLRGGVELVEQRVGQRNNSAGCEVSEALSSAIARQHSPVTEMSHDGRQEVPVLPVHTEKVDRSLRMGQTHDVDSHWSRSSNRWQHSRVDPRTHRGLRDPEDLSRLRDLGPTIAAGQAGPNLVQGPTARRVFLVFGELLQRDQIFHQRHVTTIVETFLIPAQIQKL